MKQIAIIAPTASGKTSLSIDIAHKTNSIILSLDSLSIYKQIDIASAKPSLQEREGIVHFGIDEIHPNEKFDVMKFIDIYYKAKEFAEQNSKNLMIVGGTGFYLKAMIYGISYVPPISISIQNIINQKLKTFTTEELYEYLYRIDKEYMKDIKSNDSYRIEKALSIYLNTKQKPSIYFEQNLPTPIIKDIKLFSIDLHKEELKRRIALRTKIMLDSGLIDEVIYLEKTFARAIEPMNSIGIKEVLEYLDGKIDKKELEEKIVIATTQLAKRQRTFNKGQFEDIYFGDIKDLNEKIIGFLN